MNCFTNWQQIVYSIFFIFRSVAELKIKMTAYKKLHLSFAILTIIASSSLHAVNVDPVQVQSSAGELLYAEINFRKTNPDNTINVTLATPEELKAINAVHNPPAGLNFFVRENGNGTGVITITSSRPIVDSQINLVVKVQEGEEVRLQHIKKSLTQAKMQVLQNNEQPLNPIIVANEQEIDLNLPTSTQYQNTIQTPNFTESDVLAISTQAPLKVETTPQQEKVEQKPNAVETKTTQKPKTEVKKPTTANSKQHVVQANESLWSIAAQISAQQNRSINQVMQEIKTNNEQAFVDGNASRLKRGVTLNIGSGNTTQKAEPKKPTATTNPIKTKQSGATKYRLNEAEMTLVSGNESGNGQNGKQKIKTTSAELSLKVMTSREQTVKLQRNVTQLELALHQKDHKLQLLNARLAQLQQQLKNQQVKHQPKN